MGKCIYKGVWAIMIERHCGKCERLEQKRCNLKERIVLLEAMLEGFF